MKRKSSARNIILVLLGVYALLYLVYIVLPYLQVVDIKPPEDPDMRLKRFLTFGAFLLVYMLSWRNMDAAGMLLIVGYIGSILLDKMFGNLSLEAVVLGFPLLVAGILMVKDWYRQFLNLLASVYTLFQAWRTLTYFMVIIDLEMIDKLLITGLLAVWIFGFIFVWKRPVMAGWVFVLWFLFLLVTIIMDRGGLEYPLAGIVIGLPGLVLGILYIAWGKKMKKSPA